MSLIDLRSDDAQALARPMSLLLVEDDPADAHLVQIWLDRSESSFNVRHVTSLRSALEELQDWQPDLIVSDLGLPDARGISAAERLVEAAPDVPIVVLTGATDNELAIRALDVGAEDYINKDQLSEDTLRRAVRFSVARRQAQLRFRALSTSLEEADSDLGEFAHMVAHDVRAPLRTSRLLAEAIFMQLDDSDSLMADLGARLDQTLGHLDRLVLSMLDYSGLRGAVPEGVAVNLHDVVSEVLDSLAADIAESGADITVNVDPNLDVIATREAVARTIENVLANSMKFRRADEELTIDLTASVVDGRIRIDVVDNGIGIPAAHREQVFRALERLDHAVEGSGLGLSICRRLLKSIGGDAWVVASEDPGTTVVIDLPPVTRSD